MSIRTEDVAALKMLAEDLRNDSGFKVTLSDALRFAIKRTRERINAEETVNE
jgi:hypothetical protein